MQRLQGKTILITGATSGLGKAMAHRFAEEGASIAAVGVASDWQKSLPYASRQTAHDSFRVT